ncbi:MAG: CRISPR-associated protein Cmr4 [Ruminococcaceae bacterium]|nr:CRISPR-associated protein Cmr4 [Oscillospiraceae bacterium]
MYTKARMYTKILKLRCLTNLYVGNGDENFDIIDNSVEKDPVTGYPTINSSGVKGAFREAFRNTGFDDLNNVFGAEGDGAPGKLKFLSANIIARPMRSSKGTNPYELVTTQRAIDIFNDLSLSLNAGISLKADLVTNIPGNNCVEGITCPVTNGLKDVFGINHLLVMNDSDYRSISLPVIARNKLENGKSDNLWYEEIVPHQSVFYVTVTTSYSNKKLLNKFIKHLKKLNVIQFGGNASIGYGLCEVSVLEEKTK